MNNGENDNNYYENFEIINSKTFGIIREIFEYQIEKKTF